MGGGIFNPPPGLGGGQMPGISPNIGFAGKGGQAAGYVSAILQGLRAGKQSRFANEYANVERQFQVAKAAVDSLNQQEAANPDLKTDSHFQQAKAQAQSNLMGMLDQLQNFGAGGSKKGGRGGKSTGGYVSPEDAQSPEHMKTRAWELLKHILTGPPPGRGSQQIPAITPQASTPPFAQSGSETGSQMPKVGDTTPYNGRYYRIVGIETGPDGRQSARLQEIGPQNQTSPVPSQPPLPPGVTPWNPNLGPPPSPWATP